MSKSNTRTEPQLFFLWLSCQLSGHGRPLSRFRNHSQLDTPQFVGLLWTSDQPDVENSTWQHPTLTTYRHPCIRQLSNPQPQQTNGRRPKTYTARPSGSANIKYTPTNYITQLDILILFVQCMMQIQFIRPTLRALKYEYNRHTMFYMFRHFLSAIISDLLCVKVVSFELVRNVGYSHLLWYCGSIHILVHISLVSWIEQLDIFDLLNH